MLDHLFAIAAIAAAVIYVFWPVLFTNLWERLPLKDESYDAHVRDALALAADEEPIFADLATDPGFAHAMAAFTARAEEAS